MTKQNKFGKVRSVTVFDDSKKGEIVLRIDANPPPATQDITLVMADDHESAFNGMCAVVSAGVEFGNGPPGQAPNVHVEYDDNDMEIDKLTLHLH
jgi:hypothetical protein